MNARELFPLGKASGEAFCNRVEETNKLIGNLENGKHTFIIAPRRYGKSSLCEVAFLNSGLPWGKVDFHLAITEKDIERLIITAVIQLIGKSIGQIEQKIALIKNSVKHLIPKISLHASHLKLELDVGSNSSPAENIAEAILLIDKLLVEKDQRAALLFDEFQEVGIIMQGRGIEGAIRSAAQETKKLSMVFSGSNPHLLKQMFEDEMRPLYKLCRKLMLERISPEHYLAHLNNASQIMWGQPLQYSIFDQIMSMTERHPHYVNHLCDVLWSHNDMPTTIEAVADAWSEVCEEERSDLVKDFLNLSENQKKIMKYVANIGGSNLYSSDAANTMSIPQGSVRGAIEHLLEKDFIQKYKNELRLINPVYKYILAD